MRIDRDHPGERGKYDRVEVAADDAAALRALTVTPGVRARVVEVRTSQGSEVLEFDSRVAVPDVVVDLGRRAVWPATLPPRGLGTTDIDVRVHSPVGLVLDGSPVPAVEDLDVGQVARLAMQGVPLSGTSVAVGVDPAVAAAIRAPLDQHDPLALEEHSIVLRRSALDAYGPRSRPSVSVVMATRRPDMLEHAVAQVVRQRGVPDLELVLAPHGFEARPPPVELPVRVVSVDADVVFGEVLNAAVAAAEGDVVLKMDDDDWYAPDLIADLLRARDYSGAALVGAPDDLYYLEDRDLTLRLGQVGEVYRGFVAGGTMLLNRTLLEEVGGFAALPRHVDKALTAAVREAGGAVYRTHGLGYVLRRTARGHTWDADLDDLVARAVQTWQGFRPGRLMEL
jgi:hypothetical protein